MADNVAQKVELEGPFNFRDFGGIKTQDGRVIAPKRIVRSDLLCRLTENDLKFLKENYNVKLVYDFRRNEEAKRRPDPIFEGARQVVSPVQDENNMPQPAPHEYVRGEPELEGLQHFLYTYCTTGTALDNMKGMYKMFSSFPFSLASYERFLNDMLTVKEGATIFHCLDGKDRTGVAAIYILMILGVSREDILKDYMASKPFVDKKVEERWAKYSYLEKDHLDVLKNITGVSTVDIRWASVVYEEVDKAGGERAFLRDKLHFDDKKIEDFRALYLI